MTNIGTITWFDCTDLLPPKTRQKGLIGVSEIVLVWGNGGWVQQTYYIHSTGDWFAANELPFKITHWAYINHPEQ